MRSIRLQKIIFWAALALVAGSISISTTFAQSLGSQPQPVQYIVAPENPGPNSLVDIDIEGVGSFLGNSNVIWQENGTTVLQGIGAHELTFTTGALGQTSTISVTIESTEYGTITHEFTFNPSEVDLVWEAETSAPPWYAGKPLATAGSSVSVVAFPNVLVGGARASVSNLSFQWQLDDTPDTAQSGLGKNTYTFNANQLHQNADVTVDVYSGSTAVGHGEIIVPFSQPLLVFYVDDPLRGVLYNQALGSAFSMPAQEETFRAEPYFFSTNSLAEGSLTYTWELNGQTTTGPNTGQGELTLRQTGSGEGSASLSASLQNSSSDKLLQAAQAALSISFGGANGSASQSSSFFGI